MSFGQYSDYGSGTSSSNSPPSWPPQDTWSSYQTQCSMDSRPVEQKSLSYQDLVTGKCTLEDLSRDFQMNGLDSPYTPNEDRIWSNRADGLSGMGPASAYCRQSSWPAPERSPAPRLPRPRSEWLPSASAQEFNPKEFTTSTPVEAVEDMSAGREASASLSVEQARVLASLPDTVLLSLLNDLDQARGHLQKRPKRVVNPPSWPPQDTWSSYQTQCSMDSRPVEQKSLSYQDLVTGKCTLEDLSRDFQMNGLDSPYTPNEDRIWSNRADGLSGMGPASAYCRQSSWPAPERSPAPRLPRPRSEWLPSASAQEFNPKEFTTSTPVEAVEDMSAGREASASLSVEQARVLASLPDTVLLSLLNDLDQARGHLQKRPKRVVNECRFCKNNGERESYYRAHALKDGAGRVTCPVLRAFVCKRCGARGDTAHTSKYCPLSTATERLKSTAMMRSVLMASGRRRPASLAPSVAASEHYVVFGETTPSVTSETNVYNTYAPTLPLDPLWAALERKLLL